MTGEFDPRTPVIVGAGVAHQRIDDPEESLEAVDLMIEAARRAAAKDLLGRAGLVVVPKGTWLVEDAGRAVAEAVGASTAHTVRAEIGVLQETALARACTEISAGRADVVLVCGGEAKYRAQQAHFAGTVAVERTGGPSPDELLTPHDEIHHPLEIERGLVWPVRQYAAMEVASRAEAGLTVVEHRAALDRWWSRFSEIAAANPHAWRRDAVSPEQLQALPVQAHPYTKLHCSQWNVDQAAAILIVSAETALDAGVPRDQWVFAHASAQSNLMVPLVERAELHRNPAVAAVGDALASRGVAPAACGLRELYSCFPAAVDLQVRELALDPDDDRTITGGMAFAGGPLNNFVLQAMAAMVDALRERPGERGLVTSVSGMLTKFGASVWSTTPPSSPFAALDVTADADRRTERAPAAGADDTGPATVATYTVGHERGEPSEAVLIATTAGGHRTVARCTDTAVARAMVEDEWVGRPIELDGATFRPA